MSQPESPGSQYLQRIIRQAASTPAIRAAYVGGVLAAGTPDAFPELNLYLVAPEGLDLSGWLAPLGESAYSMADETGAVVVTPDGLAIYVALVDRPAPGLQTIFERDGTLDPGGASAGLPDLTQVAGRFWHDLYKAGASIGRERPLQAHAELERCRLALIDLYRLALAPGRPGAGWEGADALPGGEKLLGPVREWLVSPLNLRAQWRCASRLAAAYESLMLPLSERLGLSYPWSMRNLAFRRLDQVRPDRPQQVELPARPDPEAEEDAPRPSGGPARFRIKRRSSGE